MLLALVVGIGPLACGGSAVDDSTPRTPIPATLAGSWSATHTGLTSYCDELGNCSTGTGQSGQLVLDPGGTFSQQILLESSLYGCDTKIFAASTGTVVVDPTAMTLVLYAQHLETKSTDTCRADKNYDRTGSHAAPWTYAYAIGADPYLPGTTDLALTDANGQSYVYRLEQ
jgi:hypothetical protein